MAKRFCSFFLVMFLFIIGLVVIAGPASAEPNCYVRADAPHYSSGARVVIAKTRFSCDDSRTTNYNTVEK